MTDERKISDAELRKKLTPLQYEVTQKCSTEPPFQNEYWDNKAEGIYVDVVSGEPLFSSKDKFDSGTGWPSFTKPIRSQNFVTKEDNTHFMKRVEVLSKKGNSHLGHVFDDGPGPTGQRYCMNSASLRFIPKDKLVQEGYGEFAADFGADASKKPQKESREVAVFAGGCFWGVEEIIRKLPGVIETSVGYTGGLSENPNYEQVKTGKTGHAEAVQVVFDPSKLSYEELLGYFFRLHDPTSANRQGNDVGTQYRSSIFYENEQQKNTATAVRDRVNKSGKWKRPVVTEIVPAVPFYPAEGYHQKYLLKNPGGYTCHWLRD